jgi:hypothetical protein
MKRNWVFIAAIVGVLTIGATGGVILAQEDPKDGGSALKGLVGRVAAILGIDESEVKAAIDQAREEIRDEAMERKLARLVEQDRLTKEQADEYREWYQSRPTGFGPRMMFGKRGGHGFFGRGMRGGRRQFGTGKWAPPVVPQVPDLSRS